MPNPYTPKKNKEVMPSPMAALARRDLGALIACIASLSGTLERVLAGILSDIMEAHSKQALAMYLALSGSQARKSALLAAAQLRISDEEYNELVKLYEKIGKNARERNKVIHGAWAVSDDCPTALLLCDSAEYSQYEAGMYEVIAIQLSQDYATLQERGAAAMSKYDALERLQYEVYEKEDLREIAVRLGNLINLVNALRRRLQLKYRWQSPEHAARRVGIRPPRKIKS